MTGFRASEVKLTDAESTACEKQELKSKSESLQVSGLFPIYASRGNNAMHRPLRQNAAHARNSADTFEAPETTKERYQNINLIHLSLLSITHQDHCENRDR